MLNGFYSLTPAVFFLCLTKQANHTKKIILFNSENEKKKVRSHILVKERPIKWGVLTVRPYFAWESQRPG